jgi:integrase
LQVSLGVDFVLLVGAGMLLFAVLVSSLLTAGSSFRSASPAVRPGRPNPQDRDLVFTRPDGTAIPPKRASQMFTRRVDAAGLPRIGVHGLRHTWATLALRAGVPVKVVSERIGHADPAATMQVYAHALEGDDATAAETTATAIFGD